MKRSCPPLKSWLINSVLWIVLGLSATLIASCRPDEAKRMFDKGLLHWEAGKYEEAIQNFVALTKAYPEHHLGDNALFWIAGIYEHNLNDSRQAIRFYRSLNNKFQSSEYYLRSMTALARIRSLEGDEGKRKAVRIYKKLQKQMEDQSDNPEWGKNQLKLSQLLLDLKLYDQARMALKQLIEKELQPGYMARAYYKIGRSYYLQGDLDMTLLTFKEAEGRFDSEKLSLLSAMNLADIYEETDRLRLAVEAYNSILKRLDKKDVLYQLANERIKKLRLRLKKTKTG